LRGLVPARNFIQANEEQWIGQSRPMRDWLKPLTDLLASMFKARARLEAEVIVLQHPL
jgi:hypothetical protein